MYPFVDCEWVGDVLCFCCDLSEYVECCISSRVSILFVLFVCISYVCVVTSDGCLFFVYCLVHVTRVCVCLCVWSDQNLTRFPLLS